MLDNINMKKEYAYGIIGALILLTAVVYFSNDSTNLVGGGGNYSFNATNVSATTTTLSAGGPAKIVLTANNARKYAVITNVGGTIAYLSLNSTTTANGLSTLADKNFVIPLAANGGSYTITGENNYTGQLIASSSAAVEIRALNAY